MDNQEKINYLNDIICNKGEIEYGGPKFLYKYRPFDKYSFDMLEEEYVYLCPANQEDDETECMTSVDYDRIMDLETNNLKSECVNQLIKMIKPYTNESNYEIVKNKILSFSRANGTISANCMLELSHELQNMVPDGVDVAPFVNWIVGIPKVLDRPEVSNQLKPLFMTAYNARKETGICSLAETNDIDYMWVNYAQDYSGYCVEYDVSNYEFSIGILPVIYEDERETNIVIQLVGSFIGQIITGMSNGQIKADSSHFIRLFLTKFKKWEYQKEWRLLGKASDKMKAPKINRIYLGRNTSRENEERISLFAQKKDIKVIKL